MASGAEHYRRAEQQIALIEVKHISSEEVQTRMAKAQVHATLALAAATAMAGLAEVAKNGEDFYDAEEDAARNWAKATMPNKAGA